MKKLLALGAIGSALAVMAPTAQAAAGTANFNVTATLQSACTVGAIADLAFGTYIAFEGDKTASTTALITCTRNLPGVTAEYDAAGGGAGFATLPTSNGLLDNGLRYTLTTTKGAVTNPGGGASLTSIGGGDIFTYTINGTILSQAGTCGLLSGVCPATTQVRTMTLNF
jgi:spore coat protein U-like protein